MNNNDLILDFDGKTPEEEKTQGSDLIIDLENWSDSQWEEWEDKAKEWEEWSEWWDLSDDIDELDKILSELSDDSWINDAAKAVEESGEQTPEVQKLLAEIKKKDADYSELQQALNDLQLRVKSLNQDKYDLTYKNAELEAFGWVTDPSLMIVVRNYEKAKWWDKIAQDKIKRMMADMYAWIYGEDLEKKEMDDKVDNMVSIWSYNSKKTPNVDIKWKDSFGISL